MGTPELQVLTGMGCPVHKADVMVMATTARSSLGMALGEYPKREPGQ
jgi:hypothetical protein